MPWLKQDPWKALEAAKSASVRCRESSLCLLAINETKDRTQVWGRPWKNTPGMGRNCSIQRSCDLLENMNKYIKISKSSTISLRKPICVTSINDTECSYKFSKTTSIHLLLHHSLYTAFSYRQTWENKNLNIPGLFLWKSCNLFSQERQASSYPDGAIISDPFFSKVPFHVTTPASTVFKEINLICIFRSQIES